MELALIPALYLIAQFAISTWMEPAAGVHVSETVERELHVNEHSQPALATYGNL
jgi:hypothetical protein